MTVIAKGSPADATPGIPEAAIQLRGLILGHIVSRAVQVTADLDLATHLHDGSKTSTQLAALCGAHAPTLSRLMRTLVSLGVFAELDGRFANNEVWELLRNDVPHSMRACSGRTARGRLPMRWCTAFGPASLRSSTFSEKSSSATLPEGNGAAYTRILDLVMLLNTPGGRERTEPEYRALLQETGFRLARAIPTRADNWILEAEKA
jgi:hypothetical protein